jgi:hypothetical protein
MGFSANVISAPNKQVSTPVNLPNSIELSKAEIEFLLTLIKNSTFSGNMIELVYDLAYKLQEYHIKINQ